LFEGQHKHFNTPAIIANKITPPMTQTMIMNWVWVRLGTKKEEVEFEFVFEFEFNPQSNPPDAEQPVPPEMFIMDKIKFVLSGSVYVHSLPKEAE
jgi:hypothetical protein